MMGWFQSLLRRFNPDADLVVSAAILADRCFDGVWQRVQLQVLNLSPSESRGYIRARAGTIVTPQVLRFAEESGLTAAAQPRVIAGPHAKRRAA